MKHIPSTLLIILIIIIMILLSGGYWFYSSQRESLQKDAQNYLRTVADLKLQQIIQWRAECIKDALMLMDFQPFMDEVYGCLNKNQDQSCKDVTRQCENLKRQYGYENVLLINRQGDIVFNLNNPDLVILPEPLKSNCLNTIKTGKIQLSDLHEISGNKNIHLDLTLPLVYRREGNPEIIGAVAIIINASDFLFPLIQTWPAPSKTSETLLVKRDGDNVLFLNQLRYHKNSALKLLISLKQITLPAVMAVMGKEGVVEGQDYRNKDVLAVLKKVPESSWYMVTKVDKDELYEEWNTQAVYILILLIILMILILSLPFTLYQQYLKKEYHSRYQTEMALRQSQEIYRVTLMSIGDAVIATDANGKVILLNSIAETLIGWKGTDAIGKSLDQIFNIINENTRKQVKNPVERVLKAGKIIGLANSTILISRDGIEHPIADSGAPIYDKDGKIMGVVLVFRDQSAERERKRKIDDLVRKSTALLSNLNGMSYRCRNDAEFTMEFVSAGCFELTGYQAEELIENKSASYKDIIHPDFRKYVSDEVNKAVSSNNKFILEYKIITKMNEEKWVWDQGQGVFSEYEKGMAIDGLITDITARKKVEEDLSRSESFLRTTGEIARVGGWELNPETMQFRWTKVTREMHEVDDAYRLTYSKLFDFFEDEDKTILEESIQLAISDGIPFDLELKFTSFKGTKLWVRKVCIPQTENDRVVKLMGIFQDITEYKTVELEKEKLFIQLNQAQKMESIGRLAGGVAHDFNNMLAVILGHAELARKHMDKDNSAYTHIVQMEAAANRSADLTSQLLAFARKQTIAPKILHLNDSIEKMLKMLQRLIGEDIDLLWQPAQDLWKVKIDPSQLDQILANLAVNARDAIEGVGKLTIETQNIYLDDDYCRQHAGSNPGEYVMLTVRDTGSGIDKKILSQIFEPFFTTKKEGAGTGLGLATVYGIVKQNNGYINVNSEHGSGTMFNIYLPRNYEEYQGNNSAGMVDEIGSTGETILLVEDEEMILKLSKHFLESLGYNFITANTPDEALRLVDNYKDAIHLLITDVIMPDMNGKELAEKIIKHRPDMRCLFMSGYTADVIAHRGIIDDGVDFIQKPFSLKTFGMKIREALS